MNNTTTLAIVSIVITFVEATRLDILEKRGQDIAERRSRFHRALRIASAIGLILLALIVALFVYMFRLASAA
jgi:hypothetical protein